jgi:hypothetical protein
VRLRFAIPLLALTLTGCSGSDQQAGCPASFDGAAWRAALQGGSHSVRLRLARQVIRCRFVKPGDTKRDVRRVLGQPPRDELQSRRDYASEWQYLLGMTNDTLGPGMDQLLFVDFNLRVSRIYIEPD